jgi:uncharacterized protein YqgC (DUF456 family)
MTATLLTVVAGILMLVGLLGIFLPLVPDVLLIWAAALGYGLLVEWGQSGPWLFGLITLLGLLAAAAEAWVSGAGAYKAGASPWSILAGLAGGVAGFFLLPPLGMVIGLLAGTFLAEYLRRKDARQAGRAMVGMGLGFGVSFVVKLVFGLAMIGAWLIWVGLG